MKGKLQGTVPWSFAFVSTRNVRIYFVPTSDTWEMKVLISNHNGNPNCRPASSISWSLISPIPPCTDIYKKIATWAHTRSIERGLAQIFISVKRSSETRWARLSSSISGVFTTGFPLGGTLFPPGSHAVLWPTHVQKLQALNITDNCVSVKGIRLIVAEFLHQKNDDEVWEVLWNMYRVKVCIILEPFFQQTISELFFCFDDDPSVLLTRTAISWSCSSVGLVEFDKSLWFRVILPLFSLSKRNSSNTTHYELLHSEVYN